jgi:hypothetical protein
MGDALINKAITAPMSRVLEGRIDIFKGKTRGPQLARKCAGRVFYTAASADVDKLDAKVDQCPETAMLPKALLRVARFLPSVYRCSRGSETVELK